MLDLNKSGLLDEERVLEIILNYNKEKQYISIRELPMQRRQIYSSVWTM